MGRNASATAGSAKPNASVATSNRLGSVAGTSAPNSVAPTCANTLASRASQPTVSDDGACTVMPEKSSPPWLGRIPNRPQKLAGTRTDPPVSVPSAKSQTPPATADADPEEEPPGTRSGAAGLSGVPVNGFSPRMPRETSSVPVLPMIEAPACNRRVTTQACCDGTGWARCQSGLPPPVGQPATSIRSFTAKLRPASGPFRAPANTQRGPGTKAFKGSSVIGWSSARFLLRVLAYPLRPSARKKESDHDIQSG